MLPDLLYDIWFLDVELLVFLQPSRAKKGAMVFLFEYHLS